jgi:hypothetical protein
MTCLRHLRIVALLAALAVLPLSVSGCGLTFSQDIALANGAVSVVQMLVTAIQGWERNYYSQHPNAEQSDKIEKLIEITRVASALAQNAVQTTQDIHSEQVTAAFADLMADYEDLLALMKDIGVVPAPAGSKLTAESLAGRLYVLPASDILPKGVDVAKVQARASAMRAAHDGGAVTQ